MEQMIEFYPNTTPREMFEEGIMGGSYFGPNAGPDKEWDPAMKHIFIGMDKDLYMAPTYRPKRNKFKVRSGMPYSYWKEMNWFSQRDPYGWIEWYIKYNMGLRSDDDYRQIKRWQDFCGKSGRWRKIIYRKIYESNNWNISPRIQQSLLHWGYRVNEEDYHLWCAMTNHKYKEVEWCAYGGLPSPAAYE